MYLPIDPKTSNILHPKLKFLVPHISGEMLIQKMLQEKYNRLSCSLKENHPGEDMPQCCNNDMNTLKR